MTLHIVARSHFTAKEFTSKFASRNSRKSPKLCNLELFSCVHTPNLFSFFLYSRTTRISEKSSFHCQPDNANVCCVVAFLPSIHWVRLFPSEMKKSIDTCAIAQQQNNPGTKLPQHLFVYARDDEIPSLETVCTLHKAIFNVLGEN